MEAENKKIKAKNKKSDILKDLEFPANFTDEIENLFAAFVQMRKEIKKPYKSKTALKTKINSISKDIDKHGEERVIQAIKLSLEHQYQGIKVSWIKDNQETQPQQQGNQVRANFKQTIYPTYEEHFKKYYPDNWEARLKHDKYRQEYEPMKAQLTAIANQYKNPTISPVFIFRAITTRLGRHLSGIAKERKLQSLKTWIADMNDYKRNKADVRQEFHNWTNQQDK